MNATKKIALVVGMNGLAFLSSFDLFSKTVFWIFEVPTYLVVLVRRKKDVSVWDCFGMIMVVSLAHIEYTAAVFIAGYVFCQLHVNGKFDRHRIILFAMVICVSPPTLFLYVISFSLRKSISIYIIECCRESRERIAITRARMITTIDFPQFSGTNFFRNKLYRTETAGYQLVISPINYRSCYSQSNIALYILQIGIIVYSHSSRVASFSNSIGEQFIKQYCGLDNLLANLYNKRTHKSLAEDISMLYLNIETPMSFPYYDCQFTNKSTHYQIRFAYITESHSIALGITFECVKQFSTNQISSALKEITSCSLFHELINTNVELLEDECSNRTDCYKGALMFLKVLTLRLRDIDDTSLYCYNPQIH